MKIKIAAVPFLRGILVVSSLFYFYAPAAHAQDTAQVVPAVTVESTGMLSLVSGTVGANVIDFGTVPADSVHNRALVLAVSANSGWNLQVSKNQDLTDAQNGNASIPSNRLTFTSSGPIGPTYVTSAAEFGAAGTPTNVVQNGEPVSEANITVSYSLNVPASQPAGYYTAFHTYTLVVT